MALLSGTRGVWQPSGCSGRSGSKTSNLVHNSSGSLQPQGTARPGGTHRRGTRILGRGSQRGRARGGCR